MVEKNKMDVLSQLGELYEQMGDAYNNIGKVLDFTCEGCPDNCCDSYFLHHTYIEWVYLWEGLSLLSEEKRAQCVQRSKDYLEQSEAALAREERPLVMCPLIEEGRCALYSHRLIICRLHGVPASLTLPNGQKKSFPGCFRCQELTGDSDKVPTMDRTKFFREMVGLEQELLGHKRHTLPRVKLTIAEMIIKGPPEI